jgi:hypothetical protein
MWRECHTSGSSMGFVQGTAVDVGAQISNSARAYFGWWEVGDSNICCRKSPLGYNPIDGCVEDITKFTSEHIWSTNCCIGASK